jgi:uncharacterized protein
MQDVVDLAIANLISPMILFFLLGAGAALLRSDLQIPEQIGKGLALYLLLAIGFKGGTAMAVSSLDATFIGAIVSGVLLSFCIPVLGFVLLRLTSELDRVTAAAVAAHYGSISAVTFVTAVGFLNVQNVPYENYLIAIMALMETPAIITGLLLARGAARASVAADGAGGGFGELAREILLNGSVVVLVGAFAIGWATGESGMKAVQPFVVEPFLGVLCLFLLDMGLVAARQLRSATALGPRVIAFGLYMPLIGAILGLAASLLVGLSLGGTLLLTVLSASASYIAVPAAMRIALPSANAAVYLTLSLAVTFPFNVLIGIPLYYAVAEALIAP